MQDSDVRNARHASPSQSRCGGMRFFGVSSPHSSSAAMFVSIPMFAPSSADLLGASSVAASRDVGTDQMKVGVDLEGCSGVLVGGGGSIG